MPDLGRSRNMAFAINHRQSGPGGQAGRGNTRVRATNRSALTGCHIGGFGPQLTPLDAPSRSVAIPRRVATAGRRKCRFR